MTDETNNMEQKQPEMTEEQKVMLSRIAEQDEMLQAFQFFSNQVNVNITLHQGIRLILEKIQKIEDKLNGNNQ